LKVARCAIVLLPDVIYDDDEDISVGIELEMKKWG